MKVYESTHMLRRLVIINCFLLWLYLEVYDFHELRQENIHPRYISIPFQNQKLQIYNKINENLNSIWKL
jgi:hypothetical protein